MEWVRLPRLGLLKRSWVDVDPEEEAYKEDEQEDAESPGSPCE